MKNDSNLGNDKSKEERNLSIHDKLIITLLLFFLGGLVCLFLSVKYSWLSGILFILTGSLWSSILWYYRLKDTGNLDRELSRNWSSQLSLLFSIVAIVYLLGSGLLLLFRHDFGDGFITTGYDVFLLLAHRYLGFNYYEDGVITNSAVLLLSVFGSVLVGGLLITTLSNIVQQRKQDVDLGVIRYKDFDGHTVVIGFGDYVIHLVKNLLMKDDETIIVLMTNQNMLMVRSKIRVILSEQLMNRLFFISGEMTCEEDVRSKLVISKAKEVYILGEANEFGVDSKCVECVKYISAALNKAKQEDKCGKQQPRNKLEKLPVYVHLEHLYSNKYIRSADDPCPVKDADNIFFRPFCFYENWGRLLWGYNSLPQYAPLDYVPVTERKHVHLVVVGLNSMGAALVLQAARICHYPNLNNNNKTIISIIERDSSIIDEFQSIYPGLSQLEDVDVRFEKQDDGNYHTFESFANILDHYAKDEDSILTIAICYRDPDQAISAALRLPESIYYQKGFIDVEKETGEESITNRMHIQVLIRQEFANGIGRILDLDKVHYMNCHIFGMFNEGLNLKLFDDTLPMYAQCNYNKMDSNDFLCNYQSFINDTSIGRKESLKSIKKEWFKSNEWARMSNRYQMDMCGAYLNVLYSQGLLKRVKGGEEWDVDDYLKNGYYVLYKGDKRPKDAPAYSSDIAYAISEIEHRRWNAERKIAGWRAPRDGEIRLDSFYIHPCIIPFKELGDETKYKDIIVLRAAPLFDYMRKVLYNEQTIN